MLDLPALFEQHNDEYLKDKRITPERRLHPLADLDAFLRLHQLVPGKKRMIAGAEHDMIYLVVSEADLAAVATEEDIVDLIRCGILYGNDGLFMFG
jgi:hypothetical protein